MLNNSYPGIVMVCLLMFGSVACQKSDQDDHVFKSQEKALKKAQALQQSLTDKINQDSDAIEQATQ